MRYRLHALFAAALVTPLLGQQPAQRVATPQPAAETKPKQERVTVREYDQKRSVALFAACDSNSDDRLDIFESRAAFSNVGEPQEIRWYRRLDQDRDGYLEWPEFDRFYRDLVQNGDALRLTLARSLASSAEIASPQVGSDLRDTIRVFDKDQDGQLDQQEAASALRSVGAPQGALMLLQLVDTNRDGKFSEAEIAPHWDGLRGKSVVAQLAGKPDEQKAALAALDLDANGSVSVAELARALRRIDPQLARWAPQIHEAADADKDGALRGQEVPAWKPEAIQGMVERAMGR
jgi:Ca2+-binding EF-hand superfamily protein